MTIFGWDTSHFDGIITLATAKKAAAEGIEFATAKVSEKDNYDDPLDGTNLRNFRDAGIKVLGGYHVVRSGGTIDSQVDYYLSLLDRDEPWWRDFPGFFHQVDLELWGYDNVSAARGIEFGKALKKKSGRCTVMYASHGQYGDRLTAWKPDPLWNANYKSNVHAPFKDLYPGDSYRGWDAYSGQVPTFLQYTSTATIGGLTTCDANAYRGTFEQLYEFITGGKTVTGEPITTENIYAQVWQHAGIPAPKDAEDQDKVSNATALQDARDTAYRIEAAVNGLKTPESGLTADDIRQIVAEEVSKALLASRLAVPPYTITYTS
jgi:hypothetical protein